MIITAEKRLRRYLVSHPRPGRIRGWLEDIAAGVFLVVIVLMGLALTLLEKTP